MLPLFLTSCEPEELENNPKAEIKYDKRVYSDTGDQSDTEDKKGN